MGWGFVIFPQPRKISLSRLIMELYFLKALAHFRVIQRIVQTSYRFLKLEVNLITTQTTKTLYLSFKCPLFFLQGLLQHDQESLI